MEFLDILLEFGAVGFGRGIVGVITEFLAIEFLQDIEMAKERVVIVEVILIRPCHMGFHRFGDGFLVVEARIAKVVAVAAKLCIPEGKGKFRLIVAFMCMELFLVGAVGLHEEAVSVFAGKLDIFLGGEWLPVLVGEGIRCF